MRRTFAAMVLGLFAGCVCGKTGSLPAIWVVPELKVRLQWNAAPGDPELAMIREICLEMNRGLFDVLDGQAYIAKFSVWNPDRIAAEAPGVGNLYKAGTICPTCRDHASTAGRPHAPQWFHTSLHENPSFLRGRANVMLHEFLHAWTGVEDEYRRTDDSRASCPDTILARHKWDACIMNESFDKTELCREENHNTATEQHEVYGMSCYAWIQKAVRESGLGEIRIPGDHLIGPRDPPEADFEYRL